MILYVHGENETSRELPLKAQWDQALGMTREPTSLAFWGDLYTQVPLTDREASIVSVLAHRNPKQLEFNKAFVRSLLASVLDNDQRQAIVSRVAAKLTDETKVVIAHGIGSIFALDALAARSEPLPLLVTIGSPLGLELLHTAVPPCIQKWFNFSDRKDPVSADDTLNDDFDSEKITDCLVVNANNKHAQVSTPEKAHSAVGYLRLRQVQSVVEGALA